jgi:hypothetical protein
VLGFEHSEAGVMEPVLLPGVRLAPEVVHPEGAGVLAGNTPIQVSPSLAQAAQASVAAVAQESSPALGSERGPALVFDLQLDPQGAHSEGAVALTGSTAVQVTHADARPGQAARVSPVSSSEPDRSALQAVPVAGQPALVFMDRTAIQLAGVTVTLPALSAALGTPAPAVPYRPDNGRFLGSDESDDTSDDTSAWMLSAAVRGAAPAAPAVPRGEEPAAAWRRACDACFAAEAGVAQPSRLGEALDFVPDEGRYLDPGPAPVAAAVLALVLGGPLVAPTAERDERNRRRFQV